MTARLLINIARRVADGLDHRAAHREHEEAIRDARLGAELATAIDLAVSRA
jgi:hypothetical protein